jgi:hypothetical protein
MARPNVAVTTFEAKQDHGALDGRVEAGRHLDDEARSSRSQVGLGPQLAERYARFRHGDVRLPCFGLGVEEVPEAGTGGNPDWSTDDAADGTSQHLAYPAHRDSRSRGTADGVRNRRTA